MEVKKYLAEFIGTFILVFLGTGFSKFVRRQPQFRP